MHKDTTEQYQVKTEAFQGPLELLLSLVEKRKLFISDVSLAAVADDYIAYVQERAHLHVPETAHFILVASTLVLIKSKSLLPTISLTAEEEASIEDLETRLKIYRRIKEAGEGVVKQHFMRTPIFFASSRARTSPTFAPDRHVSVSVLHDLVERVVGSLPVVERTPQAIVKKMVSLEDMIGRLTDRITKSLHMSFHEFSGMGKKEKVHIVVSFLAMLELVKQGAIRVRQDEEHGDIHMESHDIATPHYGS